MLLHRRRKKKATACGTSIVNIIRGQYKHGTDIGGDSITDGLFKILHIFVTKCPVRRATMADCACIIKTVAFSTHLLASDTPMKKRHESQLTFCLFILSLFYSIEKERVYVYVRLKLCKYALHCSRRVHVTDCKACTAFERSTVPFEMNAFRSTDPRTN